MQLCAVDLNALVQRVVGTPSSSGAQAVSRSGLRRAAEPLIIAQISTIIERAVGNFTYNAIRQSPRRSTLP